MKEKVFEMSEHGPFRAKVDERYHKLGQDCPDDGWVTGYLLRDLHEGEVLPHIFNCPCTWIVKEETIEPVGFHIAQWVKVEDRLPEPNTRCIFRTILDDYIPGVYLNTGETDKCWFWGFNHTLYSNITHWMPIVPPKEDLVIEDKAEYTCKHCNPYCGQCYIKSYSTVEPIGTVHYNIACTGKCEKYEKED